MKLIVGLGNPGPKYQHTRHNVGFMAVERLAEKLGASRPVQKYDAIAAEAKIGDEPAWIIQPQTFMNLSGRSVAGFCRFYKLKAADMVVLHDEIDLPLGRIRIKQGGGVAGHNGLRSIVADTGTEDFYRIRMGVGRPLDARMQVVDWVLQPFAADESERVTALVEAAGEAVVALLTEGLPRAQEKFNRRPDPYSPAPAGNTPGSDGPGKT